MRHSGLFTCRLQAFSRSWFFVPLNAMFVILRHPPYTVKEVNR